MFRATLLRQIILAVGSAPAEAAAFHSLRSVALPSACPAPRAGSTLDGLRLLALRPPAQQAAHGSVLGLRHYSGPQQALKAAAAAPSNAVRSAAQTLTKAPAAAYARLPGGVRRWVDALRHPGGLQRALQLQAEAAWQHHGGKAIFAATALLAYALFRAMRFSAGAFVEVSQSMATTGLYALTASVAAFASLWAYRRRFVISPEAVYRAAMVRLNTHPGLLEIMGAPLAGSHVRASVLTGGGLKFSGLLPRLRSRRVQMIFPLRGSERRGLVSLEAKKKRGQLLVSLLAVDVPMPASMSGEQRVYVEGGPKAYSRGGVLDELRRPFLAALSSEEAAEVEEAEEEEAEARVAGLKAAITEGGGGTGGRQGMFAWERASAAVGRWIRGGSAALGQRPAGGSGS